MIFSVKIMMFLLDVVMLAINNVRKHSELMLRIAAYGYVEAKLDAGVALYDAAEKLFRDQRTLHAKQHRQTDLVLLRRGRWLGDELYLVNRGGYF